MTSDQLDVAKSRVALHASQDSELFPKKKMAVMSLVIDTIVRGLPVSIEEYLELQVTYSENFMKGKFSQRKLHRGRKPKVLS